eukprot:CAMPEP_0184479688 /NCGR_PEP_ID=MMETSP0113_2-20130426/1302_1 /TAXON_ID=91329 /ORGANISM="Norrisiella sphaerica, Strain BC52" /LENGTH=354 /DNA_ID=CAMNT_0026857817 /DNA_START=391 /DNA_END=1455 /DNA_ORIENTATION=+
MGKNENPYLQEWVEHNRRVGVNKIVYYDDTPAHTPENRASEVLSPYIKSGYVELHDATGWDNQSFFLGTDITVPQLEGGASDVVKAMFIDKQQKMQLKEWQRFRHDKNTSRHIWLGQLDVDEFYNPKSGSLREILRETRLKGAQSIRMAKVEFGMSGHLLPTKTILDNYVMRETYFSKHTGLSLAWAITGMAPGCPHVYTVTSFLADVSRGSHECNDWHGNKYKRQIRFGVYYSPVEDANVNHYNTKSVVECFARANVPHPDGQITSRHCTARKYKICDDSILQVGRGGVETELPCKKNRTRIIENTNKVRREVLRNQHKDIIDLCSMKSLDLEESVACGLLPPQKGYKRLVFD